MPTASIVSFNIADLPWPFKKNNLQAIPHRIEKIRSALAPYDYRSIQEDWFQRMDGLPCGHWYWFPSGLTLHAPPADPLHDAQCKRHSRAGWASGDVLARKGWQLGHSQGVAFVHTHLDAGDEDWFFRKEQTDELCDAPASLVPEPDALVVAGDFNTEKPSVHNNWIDELAWMDAKFGGLGLSRVSVNTNKGKDHIYIRSVTALGAGEDATLTVLSDHPAVWVRIDW